MAKVYMDGLPVSGTASYASNVNCLDKDGNQSTVQAELDGLQDKADEQNKKFDYSGSYSGVGIVCIGNYGNCYMLANLNIPPSEIANYDITITRVTVTYADKASKTITNFNVSILAGQAMIRLPDEYTETYKTTYTQLGSFDYVLTKKVV